MARQNRVRQRHLSSRPFRHSAACFPSFGGLVPMYSAARRNHYIEYFFIEHFQRVTGKQGTCRLRRRCAPPFIFAREEEPGLSLQMMKCVQAASPKRTRTIPPNGGMV